MQLLKFVKGQQKEPHFTYFENINQPVRIKLGDISAVYSNKKWHFEDTSKNNENNINHRDKEINNSDPYNDNGENNNKLNKLYNKKLKKRNEELEKENQELKLKIEILLSKLAEAKFEIEQLRN